MKQKIKILVVDDENASQTLIKHHLISLGFSNIVSASDGEAALKILKSDTIHLIITDWHMPGVDGIDVYKNIREDPALKSIPFLMITSETGKQQVMEAMKLGIRNYIIKPVYAHILKAKIQDLLKLKE